MSCRLYDDQSSESIIHMKDLPFGKLAVIVDDSFHKDSIVARISIHADGFIQLGATYTFVYDCNLKVRVLKPGELIEVAYT